MGQFTAAVYGASGYLGSEAVRRLLGHPAIEITHVYAADHVGEPLSNALPNLEGKTSLVIQEAKSDATPPDVDVLLLALPHAISHGIVARARHGESRIIDMSGAFRVDSAEAYRRFYGSDHPMPELLTEFTYGLPELNRARIRESRMVASPGCFATTVELGLLPLARAGALGQTVHVAAMTGSSGSGASPSAGTHHPVRSQNIRTYKPLVHPHAPEISETLERAGAQNVSVRFVPISAPLVRGIFATSFVELEATHDETSIREIFADYYRSEPFVLLPEQRLPQIVAVAGSNFAEVGFALGDVIDGRRTLTVFSALDNLVKGGAGQAIQNLNLMLGVEETMALSQPSSYP